MNKSNEFLKMQHDDVNDYDICVITSANEYQAQGYKKRIEWRLKHGSLSDKTEFFIFSDPNGNRIGSGGSTIYVLYRLAEILCQRSKNCISAYELFKNKRILILHSGGDSKRIPAYSAVGKIFMPLPTNLSSVYRKNKGYNNIFVTLLEILLSNFARLPCLNDGQVVVATGDTLLSFDPKEVVFSDSGVTGLAYPGPTEVALAHGVYISSNGLNSSNPKKVLDFLQKPTREELESYKGLDPAKRALIDTGLMNFGLDAIKVFIEASGISLCGGKISIGKDSLCESLINSQIQLDIYKEIPFAMLGKDQQSNYHIALDSLRGIPFSVNVLPYCEFFHIGTSRQLIQNFHTANYTSSIYGFQNYNKSIIKDKSNIQEAFIYNSIIDTENISIKNASFIEGSYLAGEVVLDGDNVVTGILNNIEGLKLQKGICLTNIPICKNKGSWASIIYGIEDNFKKFVEDDEATFLNRLFADYIKSKNIDINELWDENESHDLWNARFFPYNKDSAESVKIALCLQMDDNKRIDEWHKCPRISLREILESVDYEKFFDIYANLCRKINLGNIANIITKKNDISSDEISGWCINREDYHLSAKNILSLIDQSDDILFQARLYKLLSNVLQKAYNDGYSMRDMNWDGRSLLSSSEYDDIAFKLVRDAVGIGSKSRSSNLFDSSSDIGLKIRSDEVVWVCAPIRFELAGGWSDTPPYCLERGGCVLNAAANLNGQYPVQVVGKIYPEPVIRINSIDLGRNVIISNISELMTYTNPEDWLSLPKSAFIASGIISQDEDRDIAEIMRGFGNGIDLTLFSAVPSGSGLGTSSILGSAVIACLSRMFGIDISQDDLFNRTLYMEQLMTTGGGWQDQIGGVVGGVKLIKTLPGLYQAPDVSWTDIKKPDMSVSDRYLLYYTGYRRMAKDILHRIVGKYLARDQETLELIEKNQKLALEMKEILDRRDIDAFGGKLAEVWELHKKIDPGITNDKIEVIFSKIQDHLCGARLLGAGSGGFLFMITKGPKHSQKIQQILTENPPNEKARFFNFEIEQGGLKVNVL